MTKEACEAKQFVLSQWAWVLMTDVVTKLTNCVWLVVDPMQEHSPPKMPLPWLQYIGVPQDTKLKVCSLLQIRQSMKRVQSTSLQHFEYYMNCWSGTGGMEIIQGDAKRKCSEGESCVRYTWCTAPYEWFPKHSLHFFSEQTWRFGVV